MKWYLLLIVSVIFRLTVTVSGDDDDEIKHIICYYGSWATYRVGNGQFGVEHIDPFLCTHLVYAFVGIDASGTVKSLDPYLDLPNDGGRDYFTQFNEIKQKNPKLKTLLSVGGYSGGSANYSIMAADPNLRKNFITTALDLVETYGYDGFDLDWEYPNQRDTVHGEADIDNFTQLIRELREEFDQRGLMLTAAVAAVQESAAQSYDIPAICELLDLVGIMTYDMAGGWDSVTGHNAPLHKGEGDGDRPREELYTVDVAIEYWLEQGCPREKLIMGLPMYGRTFNLSDPNVSGVRAPTSGSGIAGPYTMEAGFLGYNEICEKFQSETWDLRYDNLAKVPFAVQDTNWLSFDDANSLTEKIHWGLQRNISGFLVWSIETDDFRGNCGENYTMFRAINKAIETFEYLPDSVGVMKAQAVFLCLALLITKIFNNIYF